MLGRDVSLLILQDDHSLPVAVKTLKERSEDGLRSLLQEATVMGQVHHPNIVRLCGIVSGEENVSPGSHFSSPRVGPATHAETHPISEVNVELVSTD